MTTATETILEAAQTGMTVKDLVEATGKSDSTVRKAIKSLVAEGHLVKNEDGTLEVPETKVRANHGYARNTKAAKKATARDINVVAHLVEVGATSKDDLAEHLTTVEAAEVTGRAAYHALWRLRKNGVVTNEGASYSLVEDFDHDAWVEAQTTEPDPEPEGDEDTAEAEAA